jgi:hypothetical protein
MRTARTAFAALVLASTVATGCDLAAGAGIGREGGVVVSDDGRMTLEIPAGALADDVEITIAVVPGPAGSASDLYVMEPIGLVFERPVMVTFDYDAETVGEGEAHDLTLVAQREADWAYLANQRVDHHDETLSAMLLALSPVTVVVER